MTDEVHNALFDEEAKSFRRRKAWSAVDGVSSLALQALGDPSIRSNTRFARFENFASEGRPAAEPSGYNNFWRGHMALPVWLKELAAWVIKNFGSEMVVLAREQIQHQWRRFFASRNVLVLGAKQSGKSSLIQYMRTGEPFERVGQEIRAPAPTAMAAILDEKVSVQKGGWLRLKQDVPGDISLRDAWQQAINDIRPQGIVFMIDGREEDLGHRVKEIETDVLVHYASDLGSLCTLHVFVNFADEWSRNSLHARSKVRLVEEALHAMVSSTKMFGPLRLHVSETQLSPRARSWPEAERALRHFGVDVSSS